MESTPDTVITLTTGQKIMVLESSAEVVQRVIRYRHLVNGNTPLLHEAQPIREVASAPTADKVERGSSGIFHAKDIGSARADNGRGG
jgi:uncharacterized protein YlzI (FlbEa/FlbD family)